MLTPPAGCKGQHIIEVKLELRKLYQNPSQRMQRSEIYTRRAADLRPNDPDAQICPATMWLNEQTISTNSLMITTLLNLVQRVLDLTFIKPLKPMSNILVLPSEGVLLGSLQF